MQGKIACRIIEPDHIFIMSKTTNHLFDLENKMI